MGKEKIVAVALRGGFSDRMRINPVNTELQINTLDNRTRVSLVNLLNSVYDYVYEADIGQARTELLLDILSNVYLQQISNFQNVLHDERYIFNRFINKTIYEDEYDAVLTIIEYIAQKMNDYSRKCYRQINVYELFNQLFEKEYVGYRFINNIIVPITDNNEIVHINEALSNPFDNVNRHLEKALALLSDRDKPDYENSIKESISAVEAMCSDILGVPGTLGDTLKKLEKENIVTIHPALREAFIKLYGYSSDADSGIRHASKIGGTESTFQEARYMVVACAAFINYLKANLSETKRA